ncbi:hypothetical protein Ppa06_67140 [Planomonospora parontospora subsp. parontospora]|uniref:Uncharacterized protein n=2 Tax=Planomonospora parontospora TaxID=58119 RepID=A0AA37BP29_9ACTN|nr:helix-turn-helix domain-containing protein [Planomonospora parontospora]GGK98944.1 hypothetical protein GCM10010126_67940 [Planomonospora parontospora]GII12916.1 hypothetical protein Ppa06_67140 [Planomonospora parontospora subsp. parontospora]
MEQGTERTPEQWQTASDAERDAEIMRLRIAGRSMREIARLVGYASPASVHRRIGIAYVRTVREATDVARDIEVQRLDALLCRAWAVMDAEHLAVSAGRVVRRPVAREDGMPVVIGRTENGQPVYAERDVLDSGPILAAIDRVLKIMDRRARLLGLDIPARHEVLSLDRIESEIGALTRELIAAGTDPAEVERIGEQEQESATWLS